MEFDNYKHSDLTDEIIAAFYKVYNTLGYGFLERVYVNALVLELRKMRIQCDTNYKIAVYYENEIVGDYYADILVEKNVIVEVKAAAELCLEHEYQLINYLKATEMEVGLLLNFGKNPKVKRKVVSNQ